MSASNDLFNWSSQFPLQTNLQTRIACLANPFTAEALASEFVNKKAIFHKNCTRKYRADMLARKRKSQDSEAASSVSNDLKISPKKTRSTFSAPNFTDNCFFVMIAKVNCSCATPRNSVNMWQTGQKHYQTLKFLPN